VLPALPLCTCCRHYPGTATEITLAHSPSRINLPRNGDRVGLCNVLFEACSAFTRVTACTLALPPYFAARFTGGFNRFVTSTVAPVASGWSISPGGIYTHWENAALPRRTPVAVINVLTLVDQGQELGDANDQVFSTVNSKQQGGAFGLLTNGLYTREGVYTEALVIALVPFVNTLY